MTAGRGLVRTGKAAQERRRNERLFVWPRENPPYPFQVEKWEAEKNFNAVVDFSGNQIGKTTGDALSGAVHLTGLYDALPFKWPGRRFTDPVVAYIMGPTIKSVRENMQRHLFGPINDFGTGWIPKECIGDKGMLQSGGGAIDFCFVKWHGPNGRMGWSQVFLKSCDMTPESIAGPTLDLVISQEHMDLDVYQEVISRLARKDGLFIGSCTPSPVNPWIVDMAKRRHDPKAKIFFVKHKQTVAAHMTPEKIERLKATWRKDQIGARFGDGEISLYGSGLVYPTPDSLVVVEDFEIPPHWPRIAGIDFGISDDPTAIVWGAVNPKTGVLYVYYEHKVHATAADGGQDPSIGRAADVIRRNGVKIPVSWPQDGNKGKKFGKPLVSKYRDDEGCKGFLPEPCKLSDGSTSVVQSVLLVRHDMQTGRLKIFRSCSDLIAEKSAYQFEGDKIPLGQEEHLCDAMRYMWMNKDKARVVYTSELEPGVWGVPHSDKEQSVEYDPRR